MSLSKRNSKVDTLFEANLRGVDTVFQADLRMVGIYFKGSLEGVNNSYETCSTVEIVLGT